jgi:radical SAM protein with 4Fe4S-binding SPASM domain
MRPQEQKEGESVTVTSLRDDQFLAVRREFVFKVDGDRPILYSLDYINTVLYVLTPAEGLALSLLRGDKPLSELRRVFAAIAGDEGSSMTDLLLAADRRVRESPSPTGIGADGLLEVSDIPIREFQAFDPRDFIVSPARYEARMSDIKTALRLDTPINVYTVFTHRCLANCLYCYADRSRKSNEMPLARWRELIDEISELGIAMSSPDNGDTFAREDGIELLECLLEHEMHFLLSTKAYVSKEYVRRLIAAGFTKKVRGVIARQVQLSIDGADDDVVMRLLDIRRPRTADNVATFENFLSFGIMPKVKAVITGLNYDQPKRIVDLFYPRGARVYHFVRYRRSFHRHTDALFVQPEHLLVLKRQFDEIREAYPDVEIVENLTLNLGEATALSAEARLALWSNRMGCGGGWSTLGVEPDGRAFLCEQMKMDEPFFVGDARRQSIREIWDGEQMRRFIYPERGQFAGTICEACAEFEDCMWKKGRCYRDAYFAYGSVYEPPPMCPQNARPGLRVS